ncbi:MAG: DNA polymerase-3 subunit alpha, partial [Candidatus Marinamargulisbacteria bacterium]
MSQSFVHLHCHTGFSLLESSFRWKSLIDQAIDYNMSAVAVTNNGNLFGTVDFYLEAKKKNLNPIIGCDMYLTPDIDVKERAQQRIILLCKNKKGYRNLVKLVTKSHLQGFYYKPRIDMKSLAELSEDLVAISPGMRGPVAFPLQSNRDEEAKQAALQLREIYGDDFYLGIQKTGLPFEDLIIDGSVALRDSLGIPIVALNDVYYHREEDAFLRDVLSCIQTGRLLEDPARLQVENKSCYYKSPEEMIALFTTLPDAIENTLKIADLCQLDMESEQVKLPHFACPDNLTSEAYLEKLVLDGISEKYGEKTPEIAERMRFELDI